MFKIEEDYRYDWPVTVKKPVDGGTFQEHVFTARFRMIDEERAAELANESATALLREIVVGFEGVFGADDKALAFTAENRDRLLQVPYVRLALVEAYYGSQRGIGRKNSSTPPGSG